ncbi:MAG: hypothetical protein AB7W28_00420 [Armatimonadota bacterium]
MTRRLDLPVLAAILLVAAVFAHTRCPEGSFDVWWHLATGRWIVEHGAVPTADPFSYTRQGAPWIAHEWGIDLVLYGLYKQWGLYGLAIYRQVVVSASALLLYLLCTGAGAHPLVAYGCGLLLIQFIGPTLNARPQLLLPLLFLISLHCLIAHRRGRRAAIWGVPVLAAVWANVHGGFLVLYFVLAFYALDRLFSGSPTEAATPWRRFLGRLNWKAFGTVAAVSLVALAATMLNPRGLTGALYPFEYFVGETKQYTNVIVEYASPNFSQRYMAIPGLALLGFVALLLVSRQPTTLFDGLLLLFFTYSFLRWQRMVGIYGVVLLYAFAQHATGHFGWRYRPNPGLTKPLFVWSILAVGVLLFVAGVPWLVPPQRMVDMGRYPAKAIEIARLNNVRGNLFNTYHYGGYILWQYYPRPVVFIDGRADVYGWQLFQDYQAISEAGEGWKRLLDRYSIAWVVVERERALAKVLREMPDWHLLYGDRKSVLFVRDGPSNAEVIGRWKARRLRLPRDVLLPDGAMAGAADAVP